MVTIRLNKHVLHLETTPEGQLQPDSLVKFLEYYPYDATSEYDSEMWSRDKHGYKLGTVKHLLCARLAHRDFTICNP